jgi:alpha-1,4-galacturonosyltransferase
MIIPWFSWTTQLFPDLNKIVFLDEDVVVQHDMSSLWELDLNKKVVGAVVDSWCGDNCCPGKKYKDYLNFSYPIISSNFDHDRCVWLYGVNVFDLEAWRRVKITTNYHKWLKHVSSLSHIQCILYSKLCYFTRWTWQDCPLSFYL